MQTFREFEVCISDDCSTDGKEQELLDFLQQSGLSFVYLRQKENLRYDGNLRASIGLSRGQYCFLLGNDDALASPNTLQEIHDEIEKVGEAGVVITNFEDFTTSKVASRVTQTGVQGKGPTVAANNFRNVSFVSGVLLNGERARELATSKWDGSEMYQMYLTCRIIAEGGQLLTIDRVAIRKDISIPGEDVDSYAAKPRLHPCPIVERRHTFHFIGRLVLDAIQPYASPRERDVISAKVFDQLLVFTYPFWLFEYRRIQSWKYAVGICLGMRPRNFTEGLELSLWRRSRLSVIYFLSSLLGLTVPLPVFFGLYPQLHALAKSRVGQLARAVQ
jgi:glycosyltransferase involved in cell wall biosynthesis